MAKLTVRDVEREHLWLDLEVASTLLLQGDRARAEIVSRVNGALQRAYDDAAFDIRLPVERLPSDGATARRVALACGVDDRTGLRGAVGITSSLKWQQRYLFASSLHQIVSGRAGARLTVGVDDDGFGASASLARLLAHWPAQLARDGIFLALAGLACGADEGVAWADALFNLAEGVHRAGFTVVVHPDPKAERFRDAFGIDAAVDAPERVARDGWAAEVFIDLPGVAAGDVERRATSWLRSEHASGALVRANADGSVHAARYTDGLARDDDKSDARALATAARALDLRGVFGALGLPDLLEPGAYDPPTRIG